MRPVTQPGPDASSRRQPVPRPGAHVTAAARALHAAARTADSYGLLLTLLVVYYLLVASNTASRTEIVLRSVLLLATLLLALHTSRAHRRAIRFAWWGGAVALVASVAYAVTGNETILSVSLVVGVLLLVTTPIIVIRRVLSHDIVTIETVLGALCTYILIGLLFAAIFIAVNAIGTQYFAKPPSENGAPDLLYLSFVTLTTVGFGDVVAATDFGRALVTLEALAGQIFLVTLVARLVSLFGIPRRD
jgi:hypothetical protein